MQGSSTRKDAVRDPEGWGPGEGPHIRGRAQMGRTSIANSDASAIAYVNGAFDAADRVVDEQLKVSELSRVTGTL